MERSHRIDPAEVARAVWVVLTHTGLVAVLLLALWEARTVLGWALMALLFAVAFDPLVAWLTRHGLRRGLAVLLLIVLVLGIFALFLVMVVPMFVQQGQALLQRLPDYLQQLRHAQAIEWAERNFHVISRIEEVLQEQAAEIAAPALLVAAGVVRVVIGVVSVVALTGFMLVFGGELVGKILAWFSPERRAHFTALAARMQRVVGGYAAGTLFIACIGGLAMGITMVALGVPYFLPLAMIMVGLSLLPVIGSAIAAVVLVGITLASVGMQAGLIMLAIFLAYQQFQGHVLQPVVQNHTINMNPLLVTLVLLLGTSIAGLLGTLLALPFAGALQVVLQDAFERRRARKGAPLPSGAQLTLFPDEL